MSFVDTLKNKGLVKREEKICTDSKDGMDLSTIQEEFEETIKCDEGRLKVFDEIEAFHLELGYDKDEYKKLYEEAKKKGLIKETLL